MSEYTLDEINAEIARREAARNAVAGNAEPVAQPAAREQAPAAELAPSYGPSTVQADASPTPPDSPRRSMWDSAADTVAGMGRSLGTGVSEALPKYALGVNKLLGLHGFESTRKMFIDPLEQRLQAIQAREAQDLAGAGTGEEMVRAAARGVGNLATLPLDIAMGAATKTAALGTQAIEAAPRVATSVRETFRAIPEFALGMGIRKAGEEESIAGLPRGVAEGLAMHRVGELGKDMAFLPRAITQTASQGGLGAAMTTADTLEHEGRLPTGRELAVSAGSSAAMALPFVGVPGKMGVKRELTPEMRKEFESRITELVKTDQLTALPDEALAQLRDTAGKIAEYDPENQTILRGLLEVDQEAKRRANQPEGVPYGPEQTALPEAPGEAPPLTRKDLAEMATGDLDAKDKLMEVADSFGIAEPHRLPPEELVDGIMQAQAERLGETRKVNEATQAMADMQAQAEQARNDILTAQDESGRLDAIHRFEAATKSLAQTPALPEGQGFDLVPQEERRDVQGGRAMQEEQLAALQGTPALPEGQGFEFVPDAERRDRLPAKLDEAPTMPAQVTPEAFAKTYGIPETPEFLDAIKTYQKLTGEKRNREPAPAAAPLPDPALDLQRRGVEAEIRAAEARGEQPSPDLLAERDSITRQMAGQPEPQPATPQARTVLDGEQFPDALFQRKNQDPRTQDIDFDESTIRNPIDVNASPEEKAAQLRSLSEENKPRIDQALQDVDSQLGTYSKSSHKTPEGILRKATRPTIKTDKPWFDVEHIRDSFRFKTVINSLQDVPRAVGIILDKLPGTEVVKVDTAKMLEPKEWGWRFVALDLRMPNGQLVEYYMPLKEQEAAKKGGNHALFEKWRGTTQEERNLRRKEYVADLEKSYNQYQAAWEAALARSGLDEASANALWSQASASLESLTRSKLSLRSSAEGTSSDHAPDRGSNTAQTSYSDGAATQTRPVDGSLETNMGSSPSSGRKITPADEEGNIRPHIGSDTDNLFKKSLSAKGIPAHTVEEWLAPVRERLAEHITLKVANTPDQIPAAERERMSARDPNWAQNSIGWGTKDGSYIFAWNLKGDKNEVRALATHEVKHQAMFRLFERLAEEKPYNGMATQQMAKALNPLVDARRAEIEALMRSQYGKDFNPENRLHMLVGASEWLADAKNIEPKRYEQFMAAIRAALRAVGEMMDIYWLKDLKMSDAEVKSLNARIMREALQVDAPAHELTSYAELNARPALGSAQPAVTDAVTPELTAGFRRVSAAPLPTDTPVFDDPAVEARFREAAKGIGDQRGIIERGKAWLGEQKDGFTRHFIHMPNSPEFAEAHEALRQLEAAPTVAKEEAVRNLRTITDKLSPGAYDLFTRKVILDDLAHEASLGHDLPFGFTEETLSREKAKIDRAADATREVKDALATRKGIMDDLTGKLVDAGILSVEQVKNPAYFRHEVLKYAREWQNSQGTGTALKKPKPGYAKGREGSTEDISANYLEAEYAFMQRAMVDLKTAETLEKIKGKYDVMPDVKAAAEAANTRALAAMGMDARGMTEAQKRAALGGKFKSWEATIPEGYDRFQADKGLVYHTGNGITDKAMLSLMDAIQMDDKAFQAQAPEVVLDLLDGVRQQIMVGGRKPEMVLPKPIVETLNNLRPKAERGFFDQALSKPLGMLKQWMLINPRRVLKYNLNNMVGDLDAVLAGNHKALSRLPEAVRELRDVMKGGEPSQDYRDAVARGVFDSGLSVQEIPDVAKLDAFQNLLADKTGQNNPTAWMRKGWRALQDYTQFRENWMRLAAYKDYIRRIEAGEDMRSIGYGAADPRIIDALSNPKDKAAMLARSLVGDYGAVSHYGQGIRNKIIPFYSWMEVNAKRYNQLIMNAFDQGIGQGLKTGGLTAGILGARASVYLGVRMAALNMLIGAYNHIFHADDEEKLSTLDRQQLHVILGHDKDGNIHTLRLQGALSDFLDWFGYSDAVAAMKEVEKGRGSYGDVIKTMATAPVNKIAGGLTPFIKTPLELATGQSYFPDVFKPRPIQDRGREVARLFSAENEYDALPFINKPTRGYWQSWLQAVDYSRNVGEISYNNTMERIRGFKESKGVEGAGSYSTPKSRAIREFKQARRYGDDKAAEAALGKLVIQGVTREDLENSLIRSAPLAGLARKDRAEFLAGLAPKEQDQVKAAEDWYKETFLDSDELKTRYDFHEFEADYNLLHKRKNELLKAGRNDEARGLSVDNAMLRKQALIARVHELKAARKKVEESRRLPEDEKTERLGKYNERILTAMRQALEPGRLAAANE